jgi:uncharacterized membrane protein YgcG
VAAVLARLVGEGKLASEVRSSRSFFSRKDVLHLTLKVPRHELLDYERELVDKLFFDGRTETDTEAVRKHYASSGFDPSSIIRPHLERRLSQHAEIQGTLVVGGGWGTFGLFLAGLALFALDALGGWRQSLVLALVVLFASLWPYIAGLIAAFAWRKRTRHLDAASLGFLLPGLAIFAICVLSTFFDDWFPLRLFARPGLWGDLALAVLPVAAWRSLLNNARGRETASAVHRRQLLAAARGMLRRELDQREPRLRDEWLPYLLAFGLQHEMDRWFRAFGAAGVASGGFTPGSSTGSSGGGGGWTGGGGSFGGAGSSASWAAAATGLAAGVSAPSSSSGGGGGGGGGSSGGGGGGGW